MRKNYFLLGAVAIMVMASCSKESVIDSEMNKESNLIGFSSYKSITRGNPVDNNEEFMTPGNTFGVSAFISTGAGVFMGGIAEGAPITCNAGDPDNIWAYVNDADKRFWPTGDETLDFYAYSPYGNTAITNKTFDKTNGMSFIYTVPALEADQVDVMFASATGQEKPTTSNTVTMPFKHALTQVHFAVATTTSTLGIDIKANGITIHKIVGKGTFTLPPTGLEATANGWALSSQASDVTNYNVTSTAVTGQYVGDQKTYTKIGSDNNALMLLPQTFEAATITGVGTEPTGNGSYLSIKCKIYQKLGAGDEKSYLYGSAGSDDNSYATIYVPISSKGVVEDTPTEVWNRGKKVTYNMLIGGGSMGEDLLINFGTDVENWIDANGGVIENN